MQSSPDEIRKALISIATAKNRPLYGLGQVREVLRAFEEGTPHHLRSEVEAMLSKTTDAGSGGKSILNKARFSRSYSPSANQSALAQHQESLAQSVGTVISSSIKLSHDRLTRLKSVCLTDDDKKFISCRSMLALSLVERILSDKISISEYVWSALEPEIQLMEELSQKETERAVAQLT